MMDVILRNDPHMMDFNEYCDTDDVYTESVGDKVKLVANKIIEFIKSIITKIQGMYANARLNHYKKMLKDPTKVEQLKQQQVAGWNTERNKQLYAAGTDLIETTVKFFGNLVSANSTHGIDGYIKTLEKKKADIEALVQQSIQDGKTDEMWSEYDALITIIEESKQANLFAFESKSFLAILHANRKGDLDSFYGQPGVDKSKVLEMFSVTGDAIIEFNKGCMSFNAFYAGVSTKAGTYQGVKNYNTFRKKVTKSMKEKGLDANGLKSFKVTSINKEGTPMKESYEYEYDELDELNAYIEATVNDLHEAMELRNELIQESDDDTVEDFEESDDNFTDDYDEASSIKDLPDYRNNEKYNSNPRKDLVYWKSMRNPYEWDGAKAREAAERTEKVNDLRMKRIRRRAAPDALSKMPSRQYIDTKKNRDFWVDQNERTKNERPGAGDRNLQAEDTIPRLNKKLQDIKDKHRERMAAKNKSTTEYYSDAIIRNYDDEPYEEKTTYRLRSNDMFTESYDDEPYGPDRFVHEYMLDTNDDCDTIPGRSENKQKPMNRGKNKGDVIKEYMS